MKKTSFLQVLLEMIVILGSLVLGATILINQILGNPINNILVGLITIAIGAIGVIEFFTLKIAAKFKNVQSLIACFVIIALGIVFLIVDMSTDTLCIIWGAFNICFAIIKIISAFINILKQPLLNAARLLTNTVAIVFSIILIVLRMNFINSFFIFLAAFLLNEAFVLSIEFIIHRYQKL